jgi:SAM-dependent methyltransferase
MDQWQERALSFGPAADLYDAIRPSYPAPAVGWALAPLGPGAHRVADIGAGTGIMTRLLLAAGHDVVAVEPDAAMRQRLGSSTPHTTAVAGSAEHIPLPEASLDGAVAAQAYHWFDHDLAHAELARVVRAGGVFAAIWNIRDESVPWAAEYSRIVEGFRPAPKAAGYAVTSFGDGFGPVETAEFRHATAQTPDGLVRLMQSRSYYLRATPSRQASLVDEIRELARTHPDLAGRAEFQLPYVTVVYRAVRRQFFS